MKNSFNEAEGTLTLDMRDPAAACIGTFYAKGCKIVSAHKEAAEKVDAFIESLGSSDEQWAMSYAGAMIVIAGEMQKG